MRVVECFSVCLSRQTLSNENQIVVIGTDQVDVWRSEVEGATQGVVLLQTKSVLRHPVRLLQVFEAVRQEYPVVCVNVVGGGYDFASVKPLLRSLQTELSQSDMATLRSELEVHGQGVGRLSSKLSNAIPNAISVFFSPAAEDVVVDAAIKDIILKLGRSAELLQSHAIVSESTGWRLARTLASSAARSKPETVVGGAGAKEVANATPENATPDAPPLVMATASAACLLSDAADTKDDVCSARFGNKAWRKQAAADFAGAGGDDLVVDEARPPASQVQRPRGPPQSASKSQVYGCQQTFLAAEEARAEAEEGGLPGKGDDGRRLRRQSAERVQVMRSSSSSIRRTSFVMTPPC